jgi:hypothetical protein
MLIHLHICHRCPQRQAQCAGPCACKLDGRDIIDHAEKGDCPAGLFAPGGGPIELLGDRLARLAKVSGAAAVARWWSKLTGQPCGCDSRRHRLNDLHRRLKLRLSRKGTSRNGS